MGYLQIRFPELGLEERVRNPIFLHKPGLLSPSSEANFGFSPSSSSFLKISCGLRGGSRKPLWRGRVLSTEAIQAVQSLKLAKSTSKLEDVFDIKINRLLKGDLIATLVELQRQNEWEIALKVFYFARKEAWYKPDLSLYCDMIFVLGKNKEIKIAEELFSDLKKEGLKPDTRAYTEMIGAFLQVGMVEKAMEMYILMKESGCEPDKLTMTILIRNLEKCGEEEFVSTVMKDCTKYVDRPEKFINEVKKKHLTWRILANDNLHVKVNYKCHYKGGILRRGLSYMDSHVKITYGNSAVKMLAQGSGGIAGRLSLIEWKVPKSVLLRRF